MVKAPSQLAILHSLLNGVSAGQLNKRGSNGRKKVAAAIRQERKERRDEWMKLAS